MNGKSISQQQEKEDFSRFRRWLFSLDRNELLNAMEFSFQSSGGDESHEYDLLVEMVQLQPPPPTPVHPRALGYKPLSQFGPQLDYQHGAEKLRRTLPRLFQWSERQSYRPRARKGKPQPRFDVIARKKVAPWGDVFSIGCTRDQREADSRILEGSYLRRKNGTQQSAASFRDPGSTPRSIIHMLQVASRGNFLQPPNKSSIQFCAPWLQPTERWFSLSFYLASRYQLSLWESFFVRTATDKSRPIEYEPHILKMAIPSAVRIGLKQAMDDDKQKLTFLRDSLFWGLLCTGRGVLDFHEIGEDWGSVLESLTHTPLLHIHKPLSQLRIFINRSLEYTIVKEMEKAVLKEAIQSPPEQPRRKKKKKAKRRRDGVQRVSDQMEQVKTDDKSLKDEKKTCTSIETMSFDFPNNQTSPLNRNRNIVIALTILEDVMEAAFVEVGLEPTPPFESNEVKHPDDGDKVESDTGDRSADTDPSNGKPGQTDHIGTDKREPPIYRESQDTQSENRGPDQPSYADVPTTVQWPLVTSFDHGAISGGFIEDNSSSQHGLPQDFHQPIGTNKFSYGTATDDDDLDEWPFINRYQSRERSILTDFFRSQEERIDEDEKLMAASTAASISSSTYIDATVVADAEEIEKGAHEDSAFASEMNTITEDENNLSRKSNALVDDETFHGEDSQAGSDQSSSCFVDIADTATRESSVDTDRNRQVIALNGERASSEDLQTASSHSTPDCRSPSPQAPVTPPPTLSPILVSLADLRDLKRMSLTPGRLSQSEIPKMSRSYSAAAAPGSLPNSPVPPHKNGLTPSWSREDLRIASFRDDQNIKQKRPQHPQPRRSSELQQQQTYRAVAVKSLAKPIASSKAAHLDFRSHVLESSLKREQQRESCARSETAVEGCREDHHWHSDIRKPPQDEIENKSVTRDESTTITSALSQRDPEEIASIREERNSFRDMCLTLGAEVAKLNAMLAAQKSTAAVAPVDYQDSFNHPVYRPGSFDPNGMPPFFHGMQRGQRLGAMSDAGLHRGGDHESQMSEDEVYEPISKARNDSARCLSSSATIAGSDASIHSNSNAVQSGPIGVMPLYDSVAVHGLQSRLTKDILQFVNTTRMQLKKLDSKRRLAVERFSRLVNTIWPRAQVKVYGSHVSGLCLPSSDLDFVICLPAVHNHAPALAPGVLEGRNAINETSQKLLARELKGESWIDPRSIKLIERTVVPVIKVSTKDTRARMIQLDISFDSPEHHGLEANQMVSQILEDLPLIRPLMLVLKRVLLDRGLLTAYTGGLSSYCLFLMVARYLQEQSPSCGDCGSLLMGFLDFYGNYFDPRATGISVRRRHYFARPNYAVAGYEATGQPMWTPPLQQHAGSNSQSSAGPHDYLRRNSFGDTGSVDCVRRSQPSSLQRPPRFQPGAASSHRFVPYNVPHPNETKNSFGHGRPFTFDPLFVEDPLSSTNNVGRNAFRIFQVQRAFSDAHRALVASLEWDIHSSGEINDDVDYPLLKCLLKSEDVLYEL